MASNNHSNSGRGQNAGVHREFRYRRGTIDLGRPRLLAILNTTPDSFFEGSRVPTLGLALETAERFVAEGADALDIGGESTRPGAVRVSAAEQLERVLPVIRAIRQASGPLATIPISVDITLASVAAECLQAGADIINDVSAGVDDPDMLPLVAKRQAGVILMHRLVKPEQDSYSDRYGRAPVYGNVTADVLEFLSSRVEAARDAGIASESIVVDPGLGFGKDVAQNLELLNNTGAFASLETAGVLSALSRKSFVGRISLHRDSRADERLAGTLALSVQHLSAGARLFRVHDVREHRQALDAAHALMSQTSPTWRSNDYDRPSQSGSPVHSSGDIAPLP